MNLIVSSLYSKVFFTSIAGLVTLDFITFLYTDFSSQISNIRAISQKQVQ